MKTILPGYFQFSSKEYTTPGTTKPVPERWQDPSLAIIGEAFGLELIEGRFALSTEAGRGRLEFLTGEE